MKPALSRVRISSSAHLDKLKPVPVAGFIINNNYSDKTVPRLYHYRKPKLVKAKSGWYIEYYYRIPPEVIENYKGKQWYRFREKGDINRRKGDEKEIYAEWLRGEIETSLQGGYNPFKSDLSRVDRKEEKTEVNATDALNIFLKEWKTRGLEPESYSKYKKVINRLIAWLDFKKIPYIDIQQITTIHIESFLKDMKKDHGFSNREYNNHFDFTRTAFNYLLKKKYITESPCAGIDKMKAKTSKHRYYDNISLEKIKTVLLLHDPYLYFACQVTYYACIRSDKELMNLKVGNINFEQNRILIEAEGAKGSRGRYIPMDDNLRKLFIEHSIDKADPSYYVFSIKGVPDAASFGRGFFSKRFRKIRKLAGLPAEFTVYGFKFTRVVHLKHDGLDDSSIMQLTGHSDFTAYAKYLRNLGLEANPDKINKISRKV